MINFILINFTTILQVFYYFYVFFPVYADGQGEKQSNLSCSVEQFASENINQFPNFLFSNQSNSNLGLNQCDDNFGCNLSLGDDFDGGFLYSNCDINSLRNPAAASNHDQFIFQ